MSSSENGKATSNKKQTALINAVTMNGKTYQEYSQHVIYCATKSRCYSLHLLVDKGANGGVAGIDMRVIKTHPTRKVYIRGIDNHQISAIPLVTTGGVTTTITGEVIVITY